VGAVLSILSTFSFWCGAVIAFYAGRAYQYFHRARADHHDAKANAKFRWRLYLHSIPRAIAAIMFMVVASILLVRVITANPEILRPTDPAQVPSPEPS
jgi:hypothetical protein